MVNLASVHIVPTFACNLSCSFCYASKYIGKYPTLSWARYKKTLDLLVKNNIRKVLFIGGEPSIWPHIEAAIEAAQDLGMEVVLLTNAVKKVNVPRPHSVYVNGSNLLIDRLRPGILDNLDQYRSEGKRVTIRYNISTEDDLPRIKQYAAWAKEHAHSVSFAPTVPFALDKQLGKLLYELARRIVANGQTIKMIRAIPLCIFTPKEWAFLQKHVNPYGRCMPAGKGLTITPNGTMLPCNDLFIPMKYERDDLNTSKEKYMEHINELFSKPMHEKCKTCSHFGKDCQGGCLAIGCSSNQPVPSLALA